MNFVAFDVETANADLSSICQIGMARFGGGEFVEGWECLVDPEDYFDAVNVRVHGISTDCVEAAPKFADIAEEFSRRLTSEIIVSHTRFDIAAIQAVFSKHGMVPPKLRWVDSAKVARRVWPQYATKGYGLANLASDLGIEFRHHNAVEDARAAGTVLVHAMKHASLTIEQLCDDVIEDTFPRQRGSRSPYTRTESVKRSGDSEGELFGEVIVFTGELSRKRSEAADLAASAGCDVENTVTKRTTLLVVGNQDLRLLNGKDKSSKHIKAEELIGRGQAIRILQESDFETVVNRALGKGGGADIVSCDISCNFRPKMSVTELFEGPDRGLISSWEQGRKIRNSDSTLSNAASRGELPELCWAGGLSKDVQDRKFGSLHYLAMWQGLRGESLFIDRSRITRITCSKHSKTVAFTAEYARLAKKQGEAEVANSNWNDGKSEG